MVCDQGGDCRPAEIAADKVWLGREIVEIAAPWPVDNYQGLTIEHGEDDQLVAWIINDDTAQMRRPL